MLKLKDIENVMLDILRDDADKVDIGDRLKSFGEKDWEMLERLSVRHSLKALLYPRLMGLEAGRVPPGALKRFKEIYLFNLKENIILENELSGILLAFKEKNIPVVPLKGPVLSRYLYNDLAGRTTSVDLDLLVKPGEYQEVLRVMEALGYVYYYPREDKVGHDFHIECYGQAHFSRQAQNKRRFLVEIHLDLRPKFCYAPLEKFWEALEEKEAGGLRVLFPSNESLLIYLSLVCMTITEFVSLRYLYDLHSMASKFKGEREWDNLAEDLRGKRYKDSVYFALVMSRGIFGSLLPRHFLNKIRPGFFKRIFLKVWINKNNILRRERSDSRSWYYFFSSWHYLATSYLYSKNIPEALKLTYRKIFPPKESLLSGCDSRFAGIHLLLYIKRLFKPVVRLWRKSR